MIDLTKWTDVYYTERSQEGFGDFGDEDKVEEEYTYEQLLEDMHKQARRAREIQEWHELHNKKRILR